MGIYRRRYFYSGILILTVFCMALCLFGCGVEKTDESRVEDIDYCIVEEGDIPGELMEKIQEKKAADMKMVFENDDFVYIVRGYGEQETGGYSIQVTDVFLTKNAVVFRSNLVGPSKDEVKNAAPSYPYVVLKIQNMGRNVIFE